MLSIFLYYPFDFRTFEPFFLFLDLYIVFYMCSASDLEILNFTSLRLYFLIYTIPSYPHLPWNWKSEPLEAFSSLLWVFPHMVHHQPDISFFLPNPCWVLMKLGSFQPLFLKELDHFVWTWVKQIIFLPFSMEKALTWHRENRQSSKW